MLGPSQTAEELAQFKATILADMLDPQKRDEACDLTELRQELADQQSGLSSNDHTKMDQDVLSALRKLVDACDSRVSEAIHDAVEALAEIQESTCRITNQVFRGDFVKGADNTWVAEGGPQGLCDVVRVDRWRKMRPFEGSSYEAWTITIQKIVTNKSGGSGPGNCGLLDETAYEYEVRRKTHSMQCRYFKLGLF